MRITLAGRFHARCRVDGVAKEAVTRHFGADNSGDARSRVESDPDGNRLVGTVRDVKLFHSSDQIQGHRGDLTDVLQTYSIIDNPIRPNSSH